MAHLFEFKIIMYRQIQIHELKLKIPLFVRYCQHESLKLELQLSKRY
ncbi:hypothetical protein HMPREF9412_2478 [Paenibacillus sp. HGF5]|nr:hypothetical protein HMPREF9412_2478 [Paenibacillus sp. HGF5]